MHTYTHMLSLSLSLSLSHRHTHTHTHILTQTFCTTVKHEHLSSCWIKSFQNKRKRQKVWCVRDCRTCMTHVWFYFACEVTYIPVHLLQQKFIKFRLLLKELEKLDCHKTQKSAWWWKVGISMETQFQKEQSNNCTKRALTPPAANVTCKFSLSLFLALPPYPPILPSLPPPPPSPHTLNHSWQTHNTTQHRNTRASLRIRQVVVGNADLPFQQLKWPFEDD